MKTYEVLQKDIKSIISINQVKSYLKIIHNEDNDLLENLISAAIDIAEKVLKQCLAKCEIIVVFSDYLKKVSLPIIPLIKLHEVKVKSKELSDSLYEFNKNSNILTLNCWFNDEFTIRYSAGMHDIPAAIKQGILMHVAYMYDCKSMLVPKKSMDMYSLYRRIRL